MSDVEAGRTPDGRAGSLIERNEAVTKQRYLRKNVHALYFHWPSSEGHFLRWRSRLAGMTNDPPLHDSAGAVEDVAFVLLTGHGDADGFLRRDEVIDALSVFGDGELDALDATCKFVAVRSVVR